MMSSMDDLLDCSDFGQLSLENQVLLFDLSVCGYFSEEDEKGYIISRSCHNLFAEQCNFNADKISGIIKVKYLDADHVMIDHSVAVLTIDVVWAMAVVDDDIDVESDEPDDRFKRFNYFMSQYLNSGVFRIGLFNNMYLTVIYEQIIYLPAYRAEDGYVYFIVDI